jgi:hypothetical protein
LISLKIKKKRLLISKYQEKNPYILLHLRVYHPYYVHELIALDHVSLEDEVQLHHVHDHHHYAGENHFFEHSQFLKKNKMRYVN